MKKFLFLLFALALLAICQASWLQFQGKAGHTGESEDSVVVNNLLWQDSLAPLDVFAGPATHGVWVFMPTVDGLYCLDETSGEPLWRQPGSFSGVPAIIGDQIVAIQAETLRCFTLAGNHLWSRGFPTAPSYPTVANGMIYLTAGRKVYAIDSAGISRWVSADLRYGFNRNMTPCLVDTFVVVATKRGSSTIDPASVVYTLSQRDGGIINSAEYGYGFAELGCQSTPTLLDQQLYLTTYHSVFLPGYARSVGLQGNNLRWEIRNVPTYYASSAAANGRVFFAGEGLRCYDSTGVRIWVVEIGRVSYSSPLISAGVIWLGNDAGELFGVDAISGLIRWRFQCGNSPLTSPATTSSGNLVVADVSGRIYCFGYTVAVEEGSRPLLPRASGFDDGIYDATGRRIDPGYGSLPRGVCFSVKGGTVRKVIVP